MKWWKDFIDFSRGAHQREATQGGNLSESSSSSPRGDGLTLADILSATSQGALSVSTVYRCVNLLSDSVASLPLQYMRLRDGVYIEDTNSALHYLLTVQPDTYMSAFDYWKQVVQYVYMEGNAYIVPMRDPVTMEITRLALVSPACVSHNTLTDTYSVSDINAGVYGTYDESEIIHIKNICPDGKRGLSTLAFARLTTGTAQAGDKETFARFTNGGNMRGIVGNDTSVRGFGEYQDEQLQKTAKDITGRLRGGERFVAVPGQVKLTPFSLSSTDMQFLESRKFSVREICRFFGVHPSFVFDDTSNNYKSAEMSNVAFLNNTLNPLLIKIETELHRKLIAPSLCCKRKFMFDRRGIHACDLETMGKYQAQRLANGASINEIRRENNMPAVQGGDKIWINANLKDINEAGEVNTAPTAVNNTNNDE